MRVLRSRVGWFLVVIYVAGFIAMYFDAMAKALHAHEPWWLVPVVVFCGGLLLLLGAAIESAVRRLKGYPGALSKGRRVAAEGALDHRRPGAFGQSCLPAALDRRHPDEPIRTWPQVRFPSATQGWRSL